MLQITYSFETTWKHFLEKELKYLSGGLIGELLDEIYNTDFCQSRSLSQSSKGGCVLSVTLQAEKPSSCISCFFYFLEGWREQMELIIHCKAQFC